MVRKKEWTQWITGLTASFAMIIILLITAFEVGAYFDFDIYEKEYKKYNVLEELDMEMEDVMHVTREMMAYLKGNRETLSVITTVEGVKQDFFNEQDRFHMQEVRELFLGGLHLRRDAFVVLIISLLIFFQCRERQILILAKSYQITVILCSILIGVLGIVTASNFNRVFVLFHKIFFDNHLWLFNPEEDYMIRMLPEGFFFDMVFRIGAIFLAELLLLFMISIFYQKQTAKKIR